MHYSCITLPLNPLPVSIQIAIHLLMWIGLNPDWPHLHSRRIWIESRFVNLAMITKNFANSAIITVCGDSAGTKNSTLVRTCNYKVCVINYLVLQSLSVSNVIIVLQTATPLCNQKIIQTALPIHLSHSSHTIVLQLLRTEKSCSRSFHRDTRLGNRTAAGRRGGWMSSNSHRGETTLSDPALLGLPYYGGQII